ncbi:MAG: hypothetical protein P1V51_21320 [Deltaproteobacteria bacterium]|nr:hypothetical protein [Deltaproteobacteria bacterium]
MKAKRLDELKTLLEGEDFLAWWRSLTEARAALQKCIERYEVVLLELNMSEFQAELAQKNAIDTVYLSGEQEDESATFFAEASRIENESMQAVSDYEEQRYRSSDAWIRLGAVEKNQEDSRELLQSARMRGDEGRAEVVRLEALLQKLERDRITCVAEYEREQLTKDQRWERVEDLWARSLEFSLLHAERLAKAGRVKREAEALFFQAEQCKQVSETLRAEADGLAERREGIESSIVGLSKEAQERFACVAGDDFLYWGSKENDRLAWCVSLISDDRNYNMEVVALGTYRVTSREGVRRLEPPPPDGVNLEEGDRRIEAYFLGTRVTEEEEA